jgi:hypothetical protein
MKIFDHREDTDALADSVWLMYVSLTKKMSDQFSREFILKFYEGAGNEDV